MSTLTISVCLLNKDRATEHSGHIPREKNPIFFCFAEADSAGVAHRCMLPEILPCLFR